MKSLNKWLKDNNKKTSDLYSNLNEKEWRIISYQCKLSEEFIREFQDKVSWDFISYYQKLSEGFIREFKDKVYWIYISYKQKLTEEFIIEFQNKVYWYNICEYQKLSEEFIREFQDRINFNYIIPCFYSDHLQSKIKSSWRYKRL